MSSSSKKVIYAALLGNTLIAIVKFIAAAVTNSSAMLSEGIHSLVDTGNQALLLYGLKRAKRAPDSKHPYGYGKEIYFWSFVVAILIFALGAGISIYEGVYHILHPKELHNPMVNYIVLSLAICFEGFAWVMAMREFKAAKGEQGYFEAVRSGKDPTLFVVLFEDSAALIGLMVALAGVALGQLTGDAIYDGIAAVMIGILLAATAYWLAYETKGLLIGESADPQVVESIRSMIKPIKIVDYINDISSLHMGPNYILINISVDFQNSATADQVEQTVSELSTKIKRKFSNVKRVYIEAQKLSDQRA